MGSIFGGGSSTTQTAQNRTTINLDNQIANIIDVSVIAEALKSTTAQTQELIANISKAQILAQVAEVQAKMQQNEILKQSLKYAGIGIVAYGVWRLYNGK